MEWFKKHADAAVVIGAIVACVFWMNTQLRDLDTKHTAQFYELKQEIVAIKTVLIMQKIMPTELCTKEQE